MPDHRGQYRAIHTVLLTSPEYLALPAHARLVLLSLKLLMGASGIEALPGIRYQLAELTGLEVPEVSQALTTLTDSDWLRNDGVVWWLRNGLRFDPHTSLTSESTRKGIEKHLRGLPKCRLVNDFRAYYNLDRGDPPGGGLGDPLRDPPGDPPAGGVGTPPGTPSGPPRGQGRGKREEGRGIPDPSNSEGYTPPPNPLPSPTASDEPSDEVGVEEHTPVWEQPWYLDAVRSTIRHRLLLDSDSLDLPTGHSSSLTQQASMALRLLRQRYDDPGVALGTLHHVRSILDGELASQPIGVGLLRSRPQLLEQAASAYLQADDPPDSLRPALNRILQTLTGSRAP